MAPAKPVKKDIGSVQKASSTSHNINQTVHKRCTWLNANVFTPGAIEDSAMEALSVLPLSRAMELTKDVEAKGKQVNNPSAYLRAAVQRELTGSSGSWGAKSGTGGGNGAWNGVHKRCTWLNANVFGEGVIGTEAISALSSLPWERAMELLKHSEERKGELKNPNGYLLAAAQRETSQSAWGAAAQGGSGSGDVYSGVHKRCTWMNANVFGQEAINQDAVAALSCLPWERAMELLKQVEEKKGEMKNASGFLIVAASRDLKGGGNGGGGGGAGGAWSASGEDVFTGVHKRSTWLNANVFGQQAISQEAVAALSNLSRDRAMDLLKQVEEKKDQLNNPSGYLLAAVKRDFGDGGGKENADVYTGIHKRCTWLNANVFAEGVITQEAVQALSSLPWDRAMELLKHIEEKKGELKNPSGYLISAVGRDVQRPQQTWSQRGQGAAGAKAGGASGGSWHGVDTGVHKRCTWLNANVFGAGAIDEEAITVLSSLEFNRAMEITKEMEQKGAAVIKNPSSYLKAAAQREFGGSAAAGAGGAAGGGDVHTAVHKRCTWLNANVFGAGSIDGETIAALSTLDFTRAMQLCKDLEEKGKGNVANPSSYLQTAVKREQPPQASTLAAKRRRQT